MITPAKIVCQKCNEIEHEDIYEACWKCCSSMKPIKPHILLKHLLNKKSIKNEVKKTKKSSKKKK